MLMLVCSITFSNFHRLSFRTIDASDGRVGNGSANGAEDLLYFDGESEPTEETPSLSSSSSSVDFEPPAVDSFDLLTDLEQAFDKHLSAKNLNCNDGGDAATDPGRKPGDLLSAETW